MKIAHFSYMSPLSIGVKNQLQWEQSVAMDNSWKWETKVYSLSLDPSDRLNMSKKTFKYDGPFSSVIHRIAFAYRMTQEQGKYDLLLIRYDPYNPFLTLFLSLAKSKKAFLVHHSKEIPELKLQGGLAGYLKVLLEFALGSINIKLADGIVAVTDEIGKYQAARGGHDSYYLYPNGIQYSDDVVVADKRGDTPEFIFVASAFTPWQGLDKLIKSASASDAHFIIHVIGDVFETDRVHMVGDNRFIVHGSLKPVVIREISSSAWVGISSLALERQGLEEACTLKVREYLAMGIPVYGSYKEVLPDDFKYYKGEEISMASLLNYARDVRASTRGSVSDYSRPYIDKASLMRKLLSDIEAAETGRL